MMFFGVPISTMVWLMALLGLMTAWQVQRRSTGLSRRTQIIDWFTWRLVPMMAIIIGSQAFGYWLATVINPVLALVLMLASVVAAVVLMRRWEELAFRRARLAGRREVRTGCEVLRPAGIVMLRLEGVVSDPSGKRTVYVMRRLRAGDEYRIQTTGSVEDFRLTAGETSPPFLTSRPWRPTIRWYQAENHRGRIRVKTVPPPEPDTLNSQIS